MMEPNGRTQATARTGAVPVREKMLMTRQMRAPNENPSKMNPQASLVFMLL